MALTGTSLERVLSALARLDRLPASSSNGDRDQVMALCPAHDDRSPSLSVRYTGDRTLVHCFAGCEPADVLDRLGLELGDLFDDYAGWRAEHAGRDDDLEQQQRDDDYVAARRPPPAPAPTREVLLERLARLLGLAGHGLAVTAVRMFGDGPGAGLELTLSNRRILEAERVKELSTVAGMTAWLVWTLGVNVGTLKRADVLEACSIMRQLATLIAELRSSDLGRDHGLTFLGAAPVRTFRLSDQTDRYRAFAALDALSPTDRIPDAWQGDRRPEGLAIARGSLVLLDVTGWRYVHIGHFYATIRALDQVSSAGELAARMRVAGWERSGARGDVKATSPRTGATIRLRLWKVPPDWEETGDDDGD